MKQPGEQEMKSCNDGLEQMLEGKTFVDGEGILFAPNRRYCDVVDIEDVLARTRFVADNYQAIAQMPGRAKQGEDDSFYEKLVWTINQTSYFGNTIARFGNLEQKKRYAQFIINMISELSKDDLSEFKRFVEKDSPDFILYEPDYYAFFTYTMFIGNVPE